MILALEQYKQSTAAMRDKLTEIAGGLHLDDLRRELEEMDQETFELFGSYHLAVCENPDLVGATAHSLDILRKRKE